MSIDDVTRFDAKAYSEDRNLNRLLNTVVKEVKEFADNLTEKIRRLTLVGIALSSEHDINRLLELIVDEARTLTNADAGTLYTLEKDHLHFQILHNDSLNVRLGGTSGRAITLPPVPLTKTNVSSYVALTGEIVNIPDVYEAEGFDFTGPRKYDAATGYRSKSMLVVPLRNHNDEIIGVLQLLNAIHPEKKTTVRFSPEFVDLISALASQAAIALTNTKLIHDIEDLFESLVKVMATAIDARSPYNASHTERVAGLGVFLAEAINECEEGELADVNFSDEEINELRIAGWLHDVGKITTPEWVMDKPTKLTTIIDRDELIVERFTLIKRDMEIDGLKKITKLYESQKATEVKVAKIKKEIDDEALRIDKLIAFVERANQPGEFMKDEDLEFLHNLAAQSLYRLAGRNQALSFCQRGEKSLYSQRFDNRRRTPDYAEPCFGNLPDVEQDPLYKKIAERYLVCRSPPREAQRQGLSQRPHW